MKINLEFDLPEETDEFKIYFYAREYYSVLWDISEYLRGLYKHADLTEDQVKLLEEIRERLNEEIYLNILS